MPTARSGNRQVIPLEEEVHRADDDHCDASDCSETNETGRAEYFTISIRELYFLF